MEYYNILPLWKHDLGQPVEVKRSLNARGFVGYSFNETETEKFLFNFPGEVCQPLLIVFPVQLMRTFTTENNTHYFRCSALATLYDQQIPPVMTSLSEGFNNNILSCLCFHFKTRLMFSTINIFHKT